MSEAARALASLEPAAPRYAGRPGGSCGGWGRRRRPRLAGRRSTRPETPSTGARARGRRRGAGCAGPVTVTPLGAAAGAGTALLVVAAWPPRPAEPGEAGLRPFVLAGLAVVLAPWAAALGAGGSALPLAAVSLGLAWWSGRRVLVAGAALTALAVVAQHLHTGTWHLDGANGAAAWVA